MPWGKADAGPVAAGEFSSIKVGAICTGMQPGQPATTPIQTKQVYTPVCHDCTRSRNISKYHYGDNSVKKS